MLCWDGRADRQAGQRELAIQYPRRGERAEHGFRIATLDDLQAAGLITREPDPADRRARLLSITPAGSRVRSSVRSEIQRNEEHVLAELPPADRRAFLRAAEMLSALPVARILAGP